MTDIKVFQTERDKEMYALGRKDALESLMQKIKKKVQIMNFDIGLYEHQGHAYVVFLDDLKAVVERLK